MQLNQLTTRIRLRKTWEAFDLGLTMVQTWWRIIYFPWFILVSSIALLCFIILPQEYAWLATLIVWWLKPLYDRFLLNIISHQLFNEEKSMWQSLQDLPRLIKSTGLLSSLTGLRFSLSRGLNIPIWQLEQLRGKSRRKRQKLIHGDGHSAVILFMMTLLHFELILLIFFFLIILMFLPPEVTANIVDRIQNNSFDFSIFIDQATLFFYAMVVFLLEPIYVTGTFALYLNRRTELEAWDIELKFKQIAVRLDNQSQNTPSQKGLSL
ncbi:MAG TPA: hypothetical protein ENK78_07960 [Thiothrix sp.]|nr:hypothetical protein [Thiothrix sp.]